MKKLVSLIATLSLFCFLTNQCKGLTVVAAYNDPLAMDEASQAEIKPSLEEISDLLTSFIEQRGYDAHTEIHREMDNGERENTVSVVFHQRSIGEEPYDYDSLTADVNAFLAEKQIDTGTFDLRIEVQDETVEPDVKPNLEEIRDLLAGYIEQRGYKARAEVADEFENTVTVVFEQLPIGAENYDFDALTADFNAFFAEKQIDTDSFGFLVLADEGGAKDQTDRITDEQLLNWVKIDYEKKLGIAVYPEIVSRSDSAYEFAVKDKEGNVLDTYMIDPQTGTGISASGEEIDLPQTGMSSLHKVFAGLAALMGITGIGLVKRSRKEDDE